MPKFKPDDPRSKLVVKPDPRINFALNYGTKSSPKIRLYTPENLDVQLDEATKEYLQNKMYIEIHKKQVDWCSPTFIKLDFLTQDDAMVRGRFWQIKKTNLRVASPLCVAISARHV